MNWVNTLFCMIGGVGLLLYGMSLLKDNLQKIAGKKFREILILLTKNRFIGLGLGTLITLLFQSSTATTVLLVGLTSASIISLRQTLAVLLGADIGSTITAQLIALKATEVSLPVIFIGSFMFLFSKTNKKKRISLAITGFGILFLGLKLMSDTMYPLKNDPVVGQILLQISNQPLLDILMAAIFTFLIASSAATIGIIMLLTMQHMISLEPAIYMLLGANIGTTFTPLLSSLGSTREAQRVAVAHFMFKITGVLICLPFVSQVAVLMTMVTDSPGFQVANAHTFFNVAMAILFIPFIQHFARLLEIIVPDKTDAGKGIKPKFLDENLLASPELAMGMATKEIIHISDHVTEIIKPLYSLFDSYDQDKADRILQKEDHVDILSIATNNYLTKLLRHELATDEFNKALGLVNIVREYEFIGDVVVRNILGKAENMNIRNLEFSSNGQKEIFTLHQKVMQLLHTVNTAFATNNCVLAEKAKILHEDIVDLEFRLRMSHIARMRTGGKETENTSFIHMGLIQSYFRISEHLKNIAMTITNETSCSWQGEELPLTLPQEAQNTPTNQSSVKAV